MDESLEGLLAELEQFGVASDALISERPRRMLNITRDTGEFLAVLVRATGARRVDLLRLGSNLATGTAPRPLCQEPALPRSVGCHAPRPVAPIPRKPTGAYRG